MGRQGRRASACLPACLPVACARERSWAAAAHGDWNGPRRQAPAVAQAASISQPSTYPPTRCPPCLCCSDDDIYGALEGSSGRPASIMNPSPRQVRAKAEMQAREGGCGCDWQGMGGRHRRRACFSRASLAAPGRKRARVVLDSRAHAQRFPACRSASRCVRPPPCMLCATTSALLTVPSAAAPPPLLPVWRLCAHPRPDGHSGGGFDGKLWCTSWMRRGWR